MRRCRSSGRKGRTPLRLAIRASFAYVPVYILYAETIFRNDNGNSYLTSVNKTRFCAIATWNALRKVKGDR